MKGEIAYCGLACCLCARKGECPGCQAGGCAQHGWCKNYNCCRAKGLNGCWECVEFPCSGSMLDKPRIRAFARFARLYGPDEMARCLLRNQSAGVVYHYAGQLVGDYDQYDSEAEIIAAIRSGIRKQDQ